MRTGFGELLARATVARMDRSALVTGGTGGLGTAVVARLLADGWRVVVPWVAERELERVELRAGLELVEADLFEPAAVAAVASRAAARSSASAAARRSSRSRARPAMSSQRRR